MIKEVFGSLTDRLFDPPKEKEPVVVDKIVNDSTDGRTNGNREKNAILIERTPIRPDDISRAQRVIAEIIERDGIEMGNEELLKRATFEYVGRPDLDGLAPEELDEAFDNDWALENRFNSEYPVLELAHEQLLGGMPIRYDFKPKRFVMDGNHISYGDNPRSAPKNSVYSFLGRVKDLVLGVSTLGTPYSIPLLANAFGESVQEGQVEEVENGGGSNFWKYLITGIGALFAISGFGFLYTELTRDSDKDGLRNIEEQSDPGSRSIFIGENQYNTRSDTPDTDRDGLLDGYTRTLKENSPAAQYLLRIHRMRQANGNGFIAHTENGDGTITFPGELDIGTDPVKQDTDGDYVSDGLEVVVHKTNPFSRDTDFDRVQDFPEIYIYPDILDPNTPDAEKLFNESGIPDAKPRAAQRTDGGTDTITDKYVTVSMGDPVVLWYANQVDIEWVTKDEGYEIGILNLRNLTKRVKTSKSLFPSYQFVNGLSDNCYDAAINAMTLLRLKGYKTYEVSGERPDGGHTWIEAYKDGKVYAVRPSPDLHRLYPREVLYGPMGWKISEGMDYDPNWFKK